MTHVQPISSQAEASSLISAFGKFAGSLLLPPLLSLLAIWLLLAPQGAAAASPGKREAGAAAAPANKLELMENLHDALHSGQALDKAFYTEENVRKLTAARQVWVVRHQGAPERHEVAGVSFGAPGDANGGVSFRILLEIAPNGDRRAIVDGHVPREQASLRAPAVEKLVGHAWKNDRRDANTRQYRVSDGGALEKGHFKFTPSGALESFVMIRKESERPGNIAQYESRFDDGGGFLPGRFFR